MISLRHKREQKNLYLFENEHQWRLIELTFWVSRSLVVAEDFFLVFKQFLRSIEIKSSNLESEWIMFNFRGFFWADLFSDCWIEQLVTGKLSRSIVLTRITWSIERRNQNIFPFALFSHLQQCFFSDSKNRARAATVIVRYQMSNEKFHCVGGQKKRENTRALPIKQVVRESRKIYFN